MIVTPYFVYVHLHKSGGTFVNDALLRYVPGARAIGYHLPVAQIPQAALHLPVLGLVRNPWSYYVSWFSFQSGLPNPNHLFRCVSEDGSRGFADTIARLLSLERDSRLLEQVLAGLPEGYTGHGLNLPRFALRGLLGSGLGFYSYLYRYMYGDRTAHIGRMETLRSELPALLAGTGFEPPPALLDYIRNAAELNRSSHADFRSYYDEALRDQVEQADAALIRGHDYRFAPAPGAPMP